AAPATTRDLEAIATPASFSRAARSITHLGHDDRDARTVVTCAANRQLDLRPDARELGQVRDLGHARARLAVDLEDQVIDLEPRTIAGPVVVDSSHAHGRGQAGDLGVVAGLDAEPSVTHASERADLVDERQRHL